MIFIMSIFFGILEYSVIKIKLDEQIDLITLSKGTEKVLEKKIIYIHNL